MRALVVGGTGFIGRFLVPRLSGAGHEVAVVRRPESTAALPDGVRSTAADRRRLAAEDAALRGAATAG